MLYRFSAWFLVALVALPFTAPFSTCDASMLLSSSPVAIRIAIGDGGYPEVMEAAGPTTASTSILDEEQFKDALLPAVVRATAANLAIDGRVRVGTRPSVTPPLFVALRL